MKEHPILLLMDSEEQNMLLPSFEDLKSDNQKPSFSALIYRGNFSNLEVREYLNENKNKFSAVLVANSPGYKLTRSTARKTPGIRLGLFKPSPSLRDKTTYEAIITGQAVEDPQYLRSKLLELVGLTA